MNDINRRHYWHVALFLAAIQGCGSGATDTEPNPNLAAAIGSPNVDLQSSETAIEQQFSSTNSGFTLPLVDGIPTATTAPRFDTNSESSATPTTVSTAVLEAPKPPIIPVTATNEVEPEPEAVPQQINQSGFLNDRPSSIQCLELPDNAISFSDVDNDDWRAWVAPTKHHFSSATEYLSIGRSSDGKNTLRQQLVPNNNGSQTVVAGAYLSSADTYRLTQSVYLEPGFDWGGTNEGGKLGFGFGGGSAPTGGKLQTDGFTVRFMWRGNNDGTAYMTIYSYAADRNQRLPYGDDHPLVGFNVPIGEWFDLAMEVTVNTSTSKSDGSLRAWANGSQLLALDGIQWQASGNKPAIQRLMYTTFYGGNDSSWSPDKTTYIRFADVCWSPVLDNFEPLDPTLGSARNAAQFMATKDAEGTIFSDFTQNDNANLNYAALADSPRAAIINSLAEVELLLPVRDNLIDWHIYNALDRMNDSLAGPDWVDNYSTNQQAQTITYLYEAVRDSLAGASAPNAPTIVHSQLTQASSKLAQAAIDLAKAQVDLARTKSSNPDCINCLAAQYFVQQANSELLAARQLMLTAPLEAIEYAEQARKTANEAITSTDNSGK